MFNKRIYITALFLGTILSSIIFSIKKYNNKKAESHKKDTVMSTKCSSHTCLNSSTGRTKSKGLVLFDIDGTLTTGKDNYNVVQYCIDNGWDVGICTAGAIYNMNNLLQYPWMPRNLWTYIWDKSNITFNNVGSMVLAGKLNRDLYKKLAYESNIQNPMVMLGYLKGFALIETGKLLGIHDPKRLVLCDDLSMFIEGVHKFNPELQTICAGENCGGSLSINALKGIIES